jgi:molybdopterin converting factor subunit 1
MDGRTSAWAWWRKPDVRVVVRLFALAKDRAGSAEVAIELASPATVADLKRALASAFPELAPLVPNLMIAVDAEYAGDSQPIAPGAEVAAIPPVSGGERSRSDLSRAFP